MLGRPTVLERGLEMAPRIAMEAGVEVATEPAIFRDRDTSDMPQVQVDLPNVIDWAADIHSVDPQLLSATALRVCTFKRLQAFGRLSRDPRQIGSEGKVHFPVIGLGVLAEEATDTSRINRTLRHEVRHIFQPDFGKPLFTPGKLRTVRGLAAIGALAMGYEAYKLGSPGVAENLGAIDTAFLGSMLATIAASRELTYKSLHQLSPHEWDANRFARKHADFNPITLA